MKLPPAWEAIEKDYICGNGCSSVRYALERAYALHCKPPKELTEKQWREIYTECCGACGTMQDVAKAWVSAYERKQQEPETVTFRAARDPNNPSNIAMFKAHSNIVAWEWLEPAQTIEVKV
jgi:hypothetical protein